jgi:hypothetical protein
MSARREFNRLIGWLGVALVLLVVSGGGPAACAHDVREMTVDVRVHPDRTELVVVVSAHFAGVMLDESGGAPAVTADAFVVLHPRLEARGRQLCVLRSVGAEDRLVPLTDIDILQGGRDELVFFLRYGPVGGEALGLAVPLLERIDPGYVVSVRVVDAKRRLLGAQALTRGSASLTVPIVAGASAAAKG